MIIASTLKPVDDTRLYEKIGKTLADSRHYEVHIIGAPGGPTQDVTSHTLKKVVRASMGRLLLPFTIARKVFAICPDILIVATHELLFAAAVYRIFRRRTIVYDVQENYYLNIRHTDAFPFLLRPFVAAWVRLKELMLSPFVDRFLLAEKGFVNELRFTVGKADVIENKALIPPGFVRKPNSQTTELLFSGTIDASTGVFDAIDLAVALHARDPRIRLHIIGHCSRSRVLQQVRDAASQHSFIRITGGDELQPHSEIMKAIASAHFGIIAYHPSPHINNRMPTKLYEYLACQLPILIRNDLWWCDLVVRTKSGIGVDLRNPGSLPWNESDFYPGGSRNLSYEFDRDGLLDAIDRLAVRKTRQAGSERTSGRQSAIEKPSR